MTESSPARPAATIMILRMNMGSMEVLMLKRSRAVGFFPSAWVFPGGRVDTSDSDVVSTGFITGLDSPEFGVAGVRECFEESGIWLGKGVPTSDLRDALNAREATLCDVPELVPSLSRLSWWSWWTTPLTEPKRYDTRFFVCGLSSSEAQDATPDNSELVESRWITPSEAIRLHFESDFFLAPPTLITLQELSKFNDIESVWAESEKRQPSEIMPVHRKQNGTLHILFPSHSEHPLPKPNGLSSTGVWLDTERRWQPLS